MTISALCRYCGEDVEYFGDICNECEVFSDEDYGLADLVKLTRTEFVVAA